MTLLREKFKLIAISFGLIVFLSALLLTQYTKLNKSIAQAQEVGGPYVYWGALIAGSTYGMENAPWNMNTVTTFESHAGKNISIFHWGLPWFNSVNWPYNNYYPFSSTLFENVRTHGSIPFLSWAPNDGDLGANNTNQPNFSLNKIIQGNRYGANCDTATNPSCKTFDQFITEWATAAKNYGHPFMLRFAWEMNGDWYAWSELKNGNSAGQYVQAWRHVHDIFTQVGATNVTWVWCPNILPANISMESLYPGDAYVDWTCLDGYNNGNYGWKSFYDTFKPSYDKLLQIAPNKPIIIGEVSSTEVGAPTGQSKATWITDMLQTQLPNNFPKIKAVLWYNEFFNGDHWEIESSTAAQSAFAQGIASSYYGTNTYANLPAGVIQPLADPVPTPTGVTPTSCALPVATNLTPVGTTTAGQTTFSWNSVIGADYYQMRVDDTSNTFDFNCVNNNPGDVCDNYVPPTVCTNGTCNYPVQNITQNYPFNTQAGHTYNWRVLAFSNSGCTFSMTPQQTVTAVASNPTSTPTPSLTATPTPTNTPSPTPTNTPTPTPTYTPTPTPTSSQDTTPPSVSITYPANNASFRRGSTITIQATATDNVGISKVDFYVGGGFICQDTVAPYTCTWTIPNTRNATYNLQAGAYDTSNNYKVSSSVFVTAN